MNKPFSTVPRARRAHSLSSTITYNGVTYRPSQFWTLVRALQRGGYMVRIDAVAQDADCNGGGYAALAQSQKGEQSTRWHVCKSPFLALGKLVEEIQKQEAAK
ncbi:hypothetical protein M0R72_21770 [Candidatus Pacearchaeota archaeon]|jgi:hypothetical protein|nr:hypothetical protein [Candidatus Pacearchaeota archaeon]